MRSTILVIAFLLAAALAAGCTNDANAAMSPMEPGAQVAPAPTPSEVAAEKLDVAKAETKEAAQELAYARKAEFVDTMNKELVAIQAEFDRLSAKVEKSNAAQKAEAKVKLAAMREQWVRTREQLDLARDANEITWDAMRASFEKSFTDLKASVDGTRQWLSDKIEP